jgi:hypothetical protein
MDNETARDIRVAFDAYEAALMANDIEALSGFFWRDSRAVRLSAEGSLYGYDEIAAFRARRDASDIARDLLRVEILALAADIGVANAEYRRRASGRKGAQSQVWKKFYEGWRIVSAHVSLEAISGETR